MPKKSKVLEEKKYEVVNDAQILVRKLKERYASQMSMVNPDELVVLGVTNKTRGPTQKALATIHKLKPAEKKLLKLAKSPLKYYIEVYFSDWDEWGEQRRQWILYHELLHVPAPKSRGLIDHDCEDFAAILDIVGVDWTLRDNLPDMLSGEPIPFKETLISRLHGPRDEEDEIGEEEDEE